MKRQKQSLELWVGVLRNFVHVLMDGVVHISRLLYSCYFLTRRQERGDTCLLSPLFNVLCYTSLGLRRIISQVV